LLIALDVLDYVRENSVFSSILSEMLVYAVLSFFLSTRFSSALSLCYACKKKVSHKQEAGSKIMFV